MAITDPTRSMIGWREWLALPQVGVPGIKAKIDTGARTSALHTHDYEVFQRDGEDWVRFKLHPLTRTDKIELICEAPVLEFRQVKDSGGHTEDRPFIKTMAKLGSIEWEIRLSLTNREGMKFRMLLGREALTQHFVVDPTASYLLGRKRSREYRNKKGH